MTTKVTESWRIKLRQYSQELSGSLANYPFRVGQAVWCYWKTANEKEKAYFEAHITEVWDNTAEVSEISSTEVDEISSDEFVENNDIEGEGEISGDPKSRNGGMAEWRNGGMAENDPKS